MLPAEAAARRVMYACERYKLCPVHHPMRCGVAHACSPPSAAGLHHTAVMRKCLCTKCHKPHHTRGDKKQRWASSHATASQKNGTQLGMALCALADKAYRCLWYTRRLSRVQELTVATLVPVLRLRLRDQHHANFTTLAKERTELFTKESLG